MRAKFRMFVSISMVLALIFTSTYLALPAKADAASDAKKIASQGWAKPVANLYVPGNGEYDDPNHILFKRYGKHHAGVDFTSNQKKSEPVYAIADGYVYLVIRNGNESRVYIRHAYWRDGKSVSFTAVYGHVDYTVKKDTYVSKGQTIGKTMLYNSYHLHLGINMEPDMAANKNGRTGWGSQLNQSPSKVKWVNPKEWLSSHKPAPVKIASSTDGKYAVYFAPSLSWEEAIKTASKMNGYLSIITSQKQQATIAALVKKFGKSCWLGAAKPPFIKWSWINGSIMKYTNWAKGEPSGGKEKCLGIYSNGSWNDFTNNSPDVKGFVITFNK